MLFVLRAQESFGKRVHNIRIRHHGGDICFSREVESVAEEDANLVLTGGLLKIVSWTC